MKTAAALVAIAITFALVLAGCGDTKENQMKKIDEVAAQARTDIDGLAAQVGTDPVVKDDVITNCVPSRDDSGKEFVYLVHVKVTPGTLARLRGEIADKLEAKGWTANRDINPEGVNFAKGARTMGASVWEDKTTASVSGSGGCVK